MPTRFITYNITYILSVAHTLNLLTLLPVLTCWLFGHVLLLQAANVAPTATTWLKNKKFNIFQTLQSAFKACKGKEREKGREDNWKEQGKH